MRDGARKHQIVIVRGGAGGLELATPVGKPAGAERKARIGWRVDRRQRDGQGLRSRLVDGSRHKMHEVALNGDIKTTLAKLATIINAPDKVRIKLD